MSTTLRGTGWFPKNGIDLSNAPHAVGLDKASGGYDWLVEDLSRCRKRDGYEKVNDTGIAGDPNVTSFASFFKSDGSKYWVVGTEDGTIYKEVDGTIDTTILSSVPTTYPLSYVQFLDNLVITDGINVPYTWDGSATGTISAAPASALDGELHLNKLFLAIRATSQFRYSQTGDYDTWTGAGTDTVNVEQNNGQNIVALKSFARNELVIFKENSMFKFIGYDKPSFNLIAVDRSIGCISKDSIQNFRSSTSGGLLIWAYTDGIYVYDGSTAKKISQYIQPFWDSINKDYFSKMQSGIDVNRGLYFLSVPYGFGQTTCNRILVIDLLHPFQDEDGLHFPINAPWRVDTSALSDETNRDKEQQIIFGGTGYKYRFKSTLRNDDSAAIDSYVITPMMTFGNGIGESDCLRRAYVALESNSGELGVYTNIKDNDSSSDWELQQTIDQSEGGDGLGTTFALGGSPLGFLQDNFTERINIKARGRRIKVKFQESDSAGKFELQDPVEFYTKNGGQRNG